MKRHTMKWRIFKYNIIVIIVLIALTTVVFNMAIRVFIENDIKKQLNNIAAHAEDTVLHKGPDFFPPENDKNLPKERKTPPPTEKNSSDQEGNDIFRFYSMLDRSLKEPLSLLNADFILLDNNKDLISPPEYDYFSPSDEILNRIKNEVDKLNGESSQVYMSFSLDGTDYISVIKPVSDKNSFGLGWIIIYSSIQKVIQLQWGINIILLAILILASLVIAVFSSLAAKKISAPFSSLNEYLRAISERNFGTKIHLPVDDELREFVNNINVMSEKLQSYDKAQKTFLQNASHEFRTPLMSIQSYAEGIKYDVVDHNAASDIIIDETKRMTHLVEDLLYLSRLDSIEENYHYSDLDFEDFLASCAERMRGIATKRNIEVVTDLKSKKIVIEADEEKLARAFTNIIANCVRYAASKVAITSRMTDNGKLEVTIKDDGPGIDPSELPNIFERFYKGKQGNFGLGLAISRNVIEKHGGIVWAENAQSGALFKIELPIKDQ